MTEKGNGEEKNRKPGEDGKAAASRRTPMKKGDLFVALFWFANKGRSMLRPYKNGD
jgi:hypothetical protein